MNISCRLNRNMAIRDLEGMWCSLEARANGSFFLSWDWIQAWLVTYVDQYIVVQAELDGETVGLGILTERTVFRNGTFRVNQLLLHRTGIEREDQIWIEFNDFLMHADYEDDVRRAMLQCIDDELMDWDELIVGASENHVVDACLIGRFGRNDFWNTNAYWVDLDQVRSASDSYLSSISANSRAQIRRSIRLYEEAGEPVCVTQATSVAEALAFLKEAKPLHLARWKDSQRQSGFINYQFESFHRTLIASCFDKGSIELYRISVAGRLIAVHYNFLYKGCVHFYLCAINYDDDNRLKPGMMSHAMLIQHYLERGLSTYDMMGGESRYKRSLSTHHSTLVVSRVQRDRFQLRLENRLRAFKNRTWPLFQHV